MSNATLFRSIMPLMGGDHEMIHMLFEAIESEDPEKLGKAVDRMDDDERWPEDLRHDLAGLHGFRDFYDEDRMKEYEPEQRAKIKEYDEKWAIELTRRIIGYIPDDVFGHMPPATAMRVLGYVPDEWAEGEPVPMAAPTAGPEEVLVAEPEESAASMPETQLEMEQAPEMEMTEEESFPEEPVDPETEAELDPKTEHAPTLEIE